MIGGKIYFADSEGNILNAHGRKRKQDFNRAMRDYKGGSIYPVVKIANINRNIHLLVCTAFWGPRRPGQECHHLDGNKCNNRPDNLIWVQKGEEHRRFDRAMRAGIIYKHTL